MSKLDKITSKKEVIEFFADDSVSDEEIFIEKPRWLMTYLNLFDNNLNKRFFLGLNVKTDSREKLNPISIWDNKDPENDTKPSPEKIDEGGKIPDMINPPQEVIFKWEPGIWNKSKINAVSEIVIKEDDSFYNDYNSVKQFFMHPYGKSYDADFDQKGERYNILGDIFYNVLGLTDQDSCWVWLMHFDRDVDREKLNETKYLSFVLVVCENQDDFQMIVDKRLDFLNLIALVKSRYVRTLHKKIHVEAVKSAKAAIISRNLSHNLGSHVMFYIKQKLESVGKIMETGALKELINSHSIDEMKKKIESKIALGDEIEMPFLVGLGRFLNYLQERQDFIATVATNYIPYSTIINFKDTIYDELKPEKRYERHKSAETKGKKPANLLLDYIAYSEGFTSSDDIELWFGKDFFGEGNPNIVPKSLREFNVAMPGGNMGRQAFFSIMENIIRNTAKHDGSMAKDGKLKFQFDIINKDEPFDATCVIQSVDGYSLRQKDKKGQKLDLNCYNEFHNDYYYLGITVVLNEKVKDSTLKKLNEGFQQDYLTDSGQMDESCKGLKEIRISAAWIRGKELEYDIPGNEPPAVAFRKTEEGHLQYIICLPKPKRIAFVSIIDKDDQDNEIGTLDKNGCRVFKLHSREIAKYKIADFDLIVCPDADYYHVRPFVGSKVLKIIGLDNYEKRKQQFEKFRSEKPDEVVKLISDLYLAWLKQEFPKDEMVKLSICDKKAEENSPITSPFVSDKIIHCGQSSTRDLEYYKDRVLFSTHYLGQVDVIEKAKKNNIEITDETCGQFPHARFVEGISGGNSTDRLIRHDNRDTSWYCRHMAAGLSQVAIFDERLYSMFMPEDKLDIKNSVKKYLQQFPQSNANDFARGIRFNGEKKLDDINKRKVYRYLKQYTELTEDICLQSLRFLFPDYSKAWSFREKGIWAFNIHILRNDNNYDDVEIVGYNAVPTRTEIGYYRNDFCETVIAHIKRINGKIIVEPTENALAENGKCKYRFDFISIHQGLLDKIYGALKNKNNQNDILDKELVTKALFDTFYIKVDCDNYNYKNGFLPNFIIHSGRSKPNAGDMPQHLPFLQFSAIDHAVRDCKHTLTELLYSAHYEQSE